MNVHELGPFDSVLDVGGNLGDFAEACRRLWPSARITSFEPIPGIAREQTKRAGGRWAVEQVAVSDVDGRAVLHVCENQHSASTMQAPGETRLSAFGIRDRFVDVEVRTSRLDNFTSAVGFGDRLLVKIDVEGHERQVIAGAPRLLELAAAVIVEVQQDRRIFVGAPTAGELDRLLRARGLSFAGVLDCLLSPTGRVLQFDGLWLAELPLELG